MTARPIADIEAEIARVPYIGCGCPVCTGSAVRLYELKAELALARRTDATEPRRG